MESKEVVVREPSFLELVERLAINPDVDVAKIEKILDMQERVLNRNAKEAFNAAMVRAQKRMPAIVEDKKNQQTSSTYASFEAIQAAVKPHYTDEGFSLLFYEGQAAREGDVRIMVDVMHEQGHTEVRFVDIPMDMTGIAGKVNKTATHGKISSVSYGRNALIRMVFNLATEEDDGNGAGSGYITDEQYNTIHALIKDNELEKNYKNYLPTLLKLVGAESLDTIPAAKFQKCLATINDSIRNIKK